MKRSWGIALFGALAPFSIAYYVTLQFWQDPLVVDHVRASNDGYGGLTHHGVIEE